MRTFLLNSKTFLTVFFLMMLFSVNTSFAQATLNSRAAGNWNANNTWISNLLTGTITTSTGTANVTGSGTSFTTQLTVGAALYRNNGTTLIGTIQSINSNTSITLTGNAANANSGVTYMARKVPVAGDIVNISDGFSVTVTANAACGSLTINTGGNDTSLTISSTNSLTISGAVTISAPSSNNVARTIDVGDGTLSCSSITMANTSSNNRDCFLNLNNGTINVTTDIIMNGSASRNAVTNTGTGVINIGGTMSGGAFTDTSGTVNYNGSGNQVIGLYDYNNLTTSTSGNKTLASGGTISGNLLIQGSSVYIPSSTTLISNTSPVQLNGGSYRTGATAGFTEQVGVLTLTDNSNIILGTGNHTLTFAASDAAAWTSGKMLTITGWVGGYNGTAASGTNPKLFFGNALGTLTTAQLNQIQFFNGSTNFPATLLSTGELVPVVARVSDFSPSTVCAGGSITITGAGFTGATAVRVNAVNVASFIVNSSTSISAVLTTSNTTGTVSVITPGGTFTSTGSLTVNPVPSSVTANASDSAICIGGSIGLTSNATSNSSLAATILTENFNSPTNNWTPANTGTGGTVAAANWTLQADGHVASAETFHSNDNSQFYISNSDAQGSGSTTSTTLQSPAFSTVGLSAANLSFYHYYRYYNGSESINVDISTNGTSWTLGVYTFGASPGLGGPSGFVAGNVNLSSYLGQATVYVRFRYTATYDYYWAIDNVSVTGTYTIAPPATFAWTSTPSGYTSSTQNPTGVAPNAATTYTVTATNNYGCTASATTSSVTVNAVPTAGTLTPNVAAGAVCSGQSVSATATAGSGGAGTIVDELERSLSGGAYAAYTSGTAISTTGQTSVSIRTRRTATGTGCTSSSYNTVTWTVNAVPAAGTLTPNVAAGAVCSGQSVSATATAGSGGAGTIVDELERSLSGGTYAAYTSGTAISTTGQTSVSIRTRRTATGSGCTSSSYNTVTWTVNAVPVSGTLTPTPAPGTICAGTSVSATATAGSGGAGTIVDELQVSLSGGSYTTYTSGSSINTSGETSVSIRTRRTATGSGCTSSSYNTVTWTINSRSTAAVISGNSAICSGSPSNISIAITGGTSPYSVVYTDGTSNFNANSYTSGSNISVSPLASTTFTIVSVTSANGCAGTGNSGSAVKTVDLTTSTNGGTSWSNGTPTASKSAVFDGSSATLGADFNACSLRLKNNAVVTVSTGFDVTLDGRLTVEPGSTFTLNNNANLLQNTTLSNSGNIVVKRNSSALKRFDYTLWSSPVTGQGLYAFSTSTFGNRFYVYRTNTNLYNNPDVGFNVTGLNPDGVNGTDSNNVQFAQAKGYLIRMPWDHPTAATVWNGTFTGVPNNGDITYTMANNGSGFRYNLVGNPYPSPISMTQFVSDNSAKITGTLYFWRETNNNTSNNAYCSWAGGTFTTNSEAQVFNPNGIIRTGQGFFVEALNASTTVDFKNGQRSSDNSNQFFRNGNVANNADEANRFWLNLTNSAGAFSQMAAGYMTNATNGVDLYDGKNINTGNVLLNSILDNTDYTIQGKALPFTIADVIPLSYKVTDAGQYTITIDHVDGLFSGGSQPIYLKDNLTSTEHNLQTGAYSFTSAAGTFNSRFEIIYQSQLAVENPTFNANNVIIYGQNHDLVVNSGTVIMKSIKVFDIRGRLLQEINNINASQTIISGSMADAVLLVQITSEDGVIITKKAIK